MCTYNTYFRLFHSTLIHLNCHFIVTSLHNLSDLTEVTVKIQNGIQSGPETPFHLTYMEQTSVKKKRQLKTKHQKNSKSLEKLYLGIKRHFIPFKLTRHRMPDVLRVPFLIKTF